MYQLEHPRSRPQSMGAPLQTPTTPSSNLLQHHNTSQGAIMEASIWTTTPNTTPPNHTCPLLSLHPHPLTTDNNNCHPSWVTPTTLGWWPTPLLYRLLISPRGDLCKAKCSKKHFQQLNFNYFKTYFNFRIYSVAISSI